MADKQYLLLDLAERANEVLVEHEVLDDLPIGTLVVAVRTILGPRSSVLFTNLSALARAYALAATTDHQRLMQTIAEIAAAFDAVEMAYFCQQAVSRFPGNASMFLTEFTNRVLAARHERIE